MRLAALRLDANDAALRKQGITTLLGDTERSRSFAAKRRASLPRMLFGNT